jgi:hypothetical protein
MVFPREIWESEIIDQHRSNLLVFSDTEGTAGNLAS